MSSLHPYLPMLKGLAIAGSLINGGTLTSGYRLLPSIYPTVPKSPKDAAKQWEYFYWSMSATVPWVDLATFIAIGTLGYVEYHSDKTALPWKIWASAAGLMPIGWVWVRQVMLVPSGKLLDVANSSGESKENSQKTLDMLEDFNAQMGFRMMFPWVVGGLGLWASLGF